MVLDSKYYSVVIPLFNAQDTIEETLKACFDEIARFPGGEIIVIDDGSTDQSKNIVKQYDVVYKYQENQGPAKARNSGWSLSSAEFIIFIDSDCIPSPGSFESMIKLLLTNSQIGGVGGREVQLSGTGSYLAHLVSEEFQYRYSKMKINVHFLCSACAAYRRSVLNQVDGFNDQYRTASGEDNDFSFKVIQNGYQLKFIHSVYVSHRFRDSWWQYIKDQYRHAYWRIFLYKNHPQEIGHDDLYSKWDWLQPIVFGVLILNILMLTLHQSMCSIYLNILILWILFLPGSTWINAHMNFKSVFGLWLLRFVRLIAWSLGAFQGILTRTKDALFSNDIKKHSKKFT